MDNFTNIESLDLLISKYLSGKSTTAEAEELLHWINASEENQHYFTQSKFAWLQIESSNDRASQNRWEQLQNRIERRENDSVEYLL